MITVRRAEPPDADQLVRLAAAIGREPGEWLLTTETWRTASDERRYLKAVRRHTDAAVFVAVDDEEDTVVGRLSISRDPHPASTHVADLGLMVSAEYRRQGIGRALLTTAVEWAGRRWDPQARAARLPMERARDSSLCELRLRARGPTASALQPRRCRRRRAPHGLPPPFGTGIPSISSALIRNLRISAS